MKSRTFDLWPADLLAALKSDTGFEPDDPRRFVEETRRPLWGHLGVLLPGHTRSRWYPIDEHEHDNVAAAILEATSEHPWIHALTLNNRVLVVNALAVKQMRLLSDDEDFPEGDDELDWDSYDLRTQTYYQIAEAVLFALSNGRQYTAPGTTDAAELEAVEVARQEFARGEWTEDLVFERLVATHVHLVDGRHEQRTIHRDDEWHLCKAIVSRARVDTVCLSVADGDMVFIPRSELSMIDMPRHYLEPMARSEWCQAIADAEAAVLAAEHPQANVEDGPRH
jgi:hypothetical protein